MVTFGFGLIVVIIVQNWYELANGPNGMVVPPPNLFGQELFPREFHIVILAIAAALYLLARNIVDSKYGRAFLAIRESELAARGMGVNLAHYKTTAFALGAFYAGISGGLFAGLAQFINPDAFVFPVSILYVTMSILGGISTLIGSLRLTICQRASILQMRRKPQRASDNAAAPSRRGKRDASQGGESQCEFRGPQCTPECDPDARQR
jgi:branched-chain amino acid transport system permease protein